MTPAIVRPWLRALEGLDLPVAQTLSQWLPRLSLLVGPLARTHKPGGDPDGYDGVTHKGPYERLLLSEWGLAEELPEEFLRRAVMNEHLFVELHRRAPAGALHSLVLVDPGPDQLGAPRLLHLAAALVGQARARQIRAAFAWGATTEPVRVFSTVDPTSVRSVLGARRLTPISPDALGRWHAAVSRFGGEVDVLFVGGAHLEAAVAQSPFGAAFGDPKRLAARVLRVDLPGAFTADPVAGLDVSVAGTQPRRALRLPLPDERVVIHALRDPYDKGVVPAKIPELPIDAHAGLCIPPGGRKVIVRTADRIVSLVEPNSPRAPLGPARHVPLLPDDVVLAVGMEGRQVLALVRNAGRLFALFRGARTPLRGDVAPHLDDGLEGEVSFDDQLRPLWRMPGPVPVFDDETPVDIPGLDARPRAFIDGARAYAFLPATRHVVALEDGFLIPPFIHRADKLHVQTASPTTLVVGTHGGELTVPFDGETPVAHLGALHAGSKVPGALALSCGPVAWLLVEGSATQRVQSGGLDVIGCAFHPIHSACLLVRQGQELQLVRDIVRARFAFSSPVVAAVPNLEQPQLAVLTADGSVTVLFLKTGARTVICRGTVA